MGHAGVQDERPSGSPSLSPSKDLDDVGTVDFVLVAGSPGVMEVDAVRRLVYPPCLITRIYTAYFHVPIMASATGEVTATVAVRRSGELEHAARVTVRGVRTCSAPPRPDAQPVHPSFPAGDSSPASGVTSHPPRLDDHQVGKPAKRTRTTGLRREPTSQAKRICRGEPRVVTGARASDVTKLLRGRIAARGRFWSSSTAQLTRGERCEKEAG